MKAFAFATATAALLSTSYAATVKLEETACLQNNTQLDSFDVEIGSLFVKELPSVCGLKIVSADGADVNAVKCQAYKDAEGKDKGSAEFTFATPALIATNPVQEGSILCTVGDASASGTIVATATATGGPSASGNATTITSVVTGTPTQPSNPSGTATTSPSGTPGAAGRVGMSVGALAGAFAVFLL